MDVAKLQMIKTPPLTVLDSLMDNGYAVIERAQTKQVFYISKKGTIKSVVIPGYTYLFDPLIYRVACIVHDSSEGIKRVKLVQEILMDIYNCTLIGINKKEIGFSVKALIKQIKQYLEDESLPIELRYSLCLIGKNYYGRHNNNRGLISRSLCLLCKEVTEEYKDKQETENYFCEEGKWITE